MKTLLLVGVVLAVLQNSSAHQMKFGSCKAATPMENFDPQKFNGTWYVIEKLVTASDCLMTIFNVTGNTTITIQEMRAPLITQAFPIDITFTNVGKLDMDSTKKAKMALRWSGSLLNKIIKTSFTVLDTDYTNYAVDVECQSWGLFHRISATIYSRTQSLPDDIVTDLRKQLKDKFGIDLSRLNKIDHSECLPFNQTDYNIKYDEKGLSLLGLLNDKDLTQLETEKEVQEYLGINHHNQHQNPDNTSQKETEQKTKEHRGATQPDQQQNPGIKSNTDKTPTKQETEQEKEKHHGVSQHDQRQNSSSTRNNSINFPVQDTELEINDQQRNSSNSGRNTYSQTRNVSSVNF